MDADTSMSQGLLYVDLNLKTFGGGHHLAHATAVQEMLNRENWNIQFLGAKEDQFIDSGLTNYVGIFEAPAWHTYEAAGTSKIPERFEFHVRLLSLDLEKLLNYPGFKFVFIASATFPIIRAFEIFISKNLGFATNRVFFFELNHSPELGRPRGFYGHASTWYGHSVEIIKKLGINVVLLATDPWLKKDYGEILGSEVKEVALLRKITPLKVSDRLKVVAFLGWQDRHKGYHLVPDLIRKLLDDWTDWTIFVHQSSTQDFHHWRIIESQIANLKHQFGRIQFIKGPLSLQAYQQVLDQIGLLCLPYDPQFYSRAPSGVAQEAILNAIELVAPKNTTIADMVETHGYPASLFDSWNIDSIYHSIDHSIEFVNSNTNLRIDGSISLRKHIEDHSLAKELNQYLRTYKLS
jgi:hypothetical protein